MSEKYYPGKRVEVKILLGKNGDVPVWFRGIVTEPREPEHEGKIRVWLDQMPAAWQTFEVVLPPSELCAELIRSLNQPDRKITEMDELGAVFYFAAPVYVRDGLEWREALVIHSPTKNKPFILVRASKPFSTGLAESGFSVTKSNLLFIRRIYREHIAESIWW